MKYPTVIVNGVSVRVDEDGRYNLNDLHAAAVANGEATPDKGDRDKRRSRIKELFNRGTGRDS